MTRIFLVLVLLAMAMIASTPAQAAEPDYDILVIGGTASGFGAGVAAVRMGSRVALIEETSTLGGMASNGLGRTDIGHGSRANGLFEEFRQRVIRHYGGGSGLVYEPKVADAIFKEMAAEQPLLSIFYRTRAVGVKSADGRIQAVEVEDLATGRRRPIRARLYIDATIEGDVAAWAGADYRVGREARSAEEPHAGVIYYDNNTGDLLPGSTGEADDKVMSYAYLLVAKDYGPGADKTIPKPENYDPASYLYSADWPKSWPATSGALPNGKYELNQHPWGIDLPGINYDYPNADYERRAEIQKRYRDHALGYLYFLQTERGLKNLGLPDDEFLENGGVPPTLYVREARRVLGKALLTEADVTRARTRIQATSVAIGDYPMDSHAMTPPPPPTPELRHRGEGEMWLHRQTPWYQIPIGIIIPNKISNLLVSSAVSATHVAYGTLRMEPVRMSMGQAAGTLAHLALFYGRRPDQISPELVQDKLLAQGAYITWFSDITAGSRHFRAVQFLGARGLFPGDKFLPTEPVTRGEAARLLFETRRLIAPETKPETFAGPHFNDVGVTHPLYPYVESLYAAKILPGGGNFRPDAPLERGEAARWLVLSMRQIAPDWAADTSGEPRYADVSPESGCFPYVQGLAHQRIAAREWRAPVGKPEDTTDFYPESPLARDDFAMALFLAYRGLCGGY